MTCPHRCQHLGAYRGSVPQYLNVLRGPVGKYPFSCRRHPTMSAKTLCFRAAVRRVRPFVRLSRSYYLLSRNKPLKQSRRNVQEIFSSPNEDHINSGGQRSKSQQAVEVAKTSTSTLWRRRLSLSLIFLCFYLVKLLKNDSFQAYNITVHLTSLQAVGCNSRYRRVFMACS